MSKETRKDVNKTFRSGEFATSKGLRWPALQSPAAGLRWADIHCVV